MPKRTLLKVGLIVVLLLLVPFLIGRVTTLVLDNTVPRTPPPAARTIRAEGEAAIQALERVRSLTRITLVVIGAYYVVLITTLVILRRQKIKSARA